MNAVLTSIVFGHKSQWGDNCRAQEELYTAGSQVARELTCDNQRVLDAMVGSLAMSRPSHTAKVAAKSKDTAADLS